MFKPTHTFALSSALALAVGVFGCGDDRGGTPAVTTGERPVAVAGVEQSGIVAVELDFDGSASTDDGQIVAYLWDFGDGATASEVTTSHAYDEAGTYVVTLKVIDNDGNDDSDKISVTIADAPGELSIDATDTTIMGDDYVVTAVGGEGYDGLAWNFGDSPDSIDAEDGEMSLTHVYGAWGPFVVTLTGTVGDQTSVATHDVTVLARPTAVPDANPRVAAPGETISFSGTGSSDPDGQIVTYAWDFGDNFFGEGSSVDHTYSVAGGFDVILTVTDNDGLQHSAGFKLTVEGGGEPPVADCGPATRDVQIGAPATFDGSGSSDADGDIVAYTWRFSDSPGDGVLGETVQHTFDGEGEYTVELVVMDDSGQQDTAQCIVNAVDVPFSGMDGLYNVGPPINYSCSFGLVSITVQQFQFTTAGSTMTIQGLPGGFFQTTINMSESPAPAGMQFSASQAILGNPSSSGNCEEYYSLQGEFTDNDHWTGTFETEFVDSNSDGACSDCSAMSYAVSGTRQ